MSSFVAVFSRALLFYVVISVGCRVLVASCVIRGRADFLPRAQFLPCNMPWEEQPFCSMSLRRSQFKILKVCEGSGGYAQHSSVPVARSRFKLNEAPNLVVLRVAQVRFPQRGVGVTPRSVGKKTVLVHQSLRGATSKLHARPVSRVHAPSVS